jgi:hypothetical protein
MSRQNHTPRSLEERLLTESRRTAGIDSHGQPGRLGGRDSGGYIVGYIDDQGLAWQSLAEQLVATRAGLLAEALQLPDSDRRRDELLEELLADVPDELLGEVAREAGALLALRCLAQWDDSDR